jgi:hypothetical protein
VWCYVGSATTSAKRTYCRACNPIGSTSTSACVPWAPRCELDAAAAGLRLVTCRPCMTSMRAIRARFGSCNNFSLGYVSGWGGPTGRTRGPCSLPSVFALHYSQICALLVSSPKAYGEAPPPSSQRTCCRTCPGRSRFRLWYHLCPISPPALLSNIMFQHTDVL